MHPPGNEVMAAAISCVACSELVLAQCGLDCLAVDLRLVVWKLAWCTALTHMPSDAAYHAHAERMLHTHAESVRFAVRIPTQA